MKILKIMTSVLLMFTACLLQVSCGGGGKTPDDASSGTTATGDGGNEYTPAIPEYISSVPKAKVQARSLYFIDQPDSFSEKITLATLQGLSANFANDQIFIRAGGYSSYEKYLKNDFGCKMPLKVDGKPITLANLIKHYKDGLSGYILCKNDPGSDSGSVAISLSGVLNAVVATPENASLCESAGLTCLIDVTGKDDKWLRSSEYFDMLNKDIAFEQPLDAVPKLADLAAMSGSYFSFYSGHDRSAHNTKYSFLNRGGIVFGYNNTLGEYDTVYSFSAMNLQMIPSDHATNLSTLSGFVVNEMKQKTEKTETEVGKQVHTVCLIMSDGDNVQWLLNDFTVSSKWFGNKNRGLFDMGWGLPATAIDLCAPMNAYLYDKMTEKDEFIMQLGGLGYTFPSKWSTSDRTKMAEKLSEYMKRQDLRFAEILDDSGMTGTALAPFTKQENIDGLFYIDYSNYAGMKGKILWSNGKPVVGARYRLWNNTSDGSVDAIAKAINKASKDPTKAASYSFVIVHAWSGLEGSRLVEGGQTMDAVAKLVDAFGEGVEVVTPSEFMDRIIANHAQ